MKFINPIQLFQNPLINHKDTGAQGCGRNLGQIQWHLPAGAGEGFGRSIASCFRCSLPFEDFGWPIGLHQECTEAFHQI
jgi:hypothetical protein